ncbi:MAG TPA: amidohydrolase family protein [Lentisphaeria bacterium]|nr:amidohydrolase [Lentisphaerota bacterium]HPY89495.1 amidohydrolase family protein [Lentisphaeria bacterium]HQC52994.1 amidohydrolase family protein [Lentisphaeria bacterium]HQL87418.1 amidohydrolase family protein [Lentisphaeria bacterium]
MIIDIHGHLGNINFAPFWQADGKELERLARLAGVDKLCVSSARAIMYDTQEGNRELDETLREADRLYGLVVVNPMFPASADDLSLLTSNPRFRGVKIHPDYHGFSMESPEALRWLDPIAESVEFMLFHTSCMPGTGFAAAPLVARFAQRHPKTNFVMAHLAGLYQNGNYPYFPNLIGLETVAAMRLPNVWVDTAHFLMYAYKDVMAHAVRIIGAERLVFGTDVPLQSDMQMRFAIEAIQDLPISDGDKALILGETAKGLLKL